MHTSQISISSSTATPSDCRLSTTELVQSCLLGARESSLSYGCNYVWPLSVYYRTGTVACAWVTCTQPMCACVGHLNLLKVACARARAHTHPLLSTWQHCSPMNSHTSVHCPACLPSVYRSRWPCRLKNDIDHVHRSWRKVCMITHDTELYSHVQPHHDKARGEIVWASSTKRKENSKVILSSFYLC